MTDLPPPSASVDDRFAAPPTFLPTDELLFRIKRLIIAMAATALVLGVLPLPPYVHVIVLLAVPMFILVAAISANDMERTRFVWRYARKLWTYRRDPGYLAAAGERAREPVRTGLRRAWLLLGLFVAIFLIGLVLAGISAGISEAIYD